MIKDLIRHYNELLKADGCSARIYLRADGRLQLQATLPPSPDSEKVHPHQQRIALKLTASPETLEIADRKARILSRAIADGTFEWNDWKPSSTPKGKTCGEWITAYRTDFFDRRASTPQTLSTWEDHCKFLKKLPEDKLLTSRLLKEVLLGIPPDTRSRQKASRIFTKLGHLAGLQLDFSQYAGNYGLKDLDPRDLPADEEILAWYFKISSPDWQLAYGLIAAYGIRPHELLHLELNPPELTILDGKTGFRLAYPCPHQWAEEWNLSTLKLLPSISGKDHSAIGQRVTHAFKRLGIPFRPYDLRHCWAIRSIHHYEPAIAAKMMGHSLTTHNQRYHRWLGAAHLKEAYDRSRGLLEP